MDPLLLPSMLVPVLVCALIAGGFVGLLLLGELVIWLLGILSPPPDDQVVLARALADGMRTRRPLAAILADLIGRVRFPYNRRLERAAHDAAGDERYELGDLIARHRLFGKGLGRAVANLAAARPARVAVLLDATPEPPASDLFILCCLYFLYVNVFGTLINFVGNLVGPKFDRVLNHIGVEHGTIYMLVRDWSGLLVFVLWLGMGLLLVLLLRQRLRASEPGRYQRGRLVLEGLMAHRPEDELVETVAAVWPGLRPRLAAPAAVGDTPGLIRACGWRARDAGSLSRALLRYERRRRRLHAWAVLLLRCLLPCLLGGLVLLVVLAYYKDTLLRIVESQL